MEPDKWNGFLEAYSLEQMKVEALVNLCHEVITEIKNEPKKKNYQKDLEEILNGPSSSNR